MGNYLYKKQYFDIIEPEGEHTHTLIFLHGLGDKGKSFKFYFGYDGCLAFPNLKVLLPTADSKPVSCNDGRYMNSWFDILSLGE
jgi:predicted esterase